MGDYNPHSPYVIGNEFVGLREEELYLTNAADTVEYGYGLTLSATRTLQDGRVYFDAPYWALPINQMLQVNVYPRGLEAASGPIQSVQIPVSATGTNIAANSENVSNLRYDSQVITPASNATATQIARALQSPLQGAFWFYAPETGDTGNGQLNLYFETQPYLPQLLGKRILGVNVLLKIDGPGADDQSVMYGGALRMDVGWVNSNGQIIRANLTTSSDLQRIRLPTVSPWSVTGAGTSLSNIVSNWNVSELNNFAFEAIAATRISARLVRAIQTIPSNVPTFIWPYLISFAALEVVYCEEQRVATGAIYSGNVSTASQYGAQILSMRSPNGTNNPALGGGDYTFTVSAPVNGLFGNSSVELLPPVNALRNLYALPNLPGMQISKPFPPEASLGQSFSVATSDVMPQISLHTSSTPIPETHVYGRTAPAPVYGSIVASQGIGSAATNNALLYPQVRFYARRFGSTTRSLQLTQGAFGASITPAAFDALPSIVDGWKEVTLRLPSAPTGMQVNAGPWQWAAGGENIGSRWEVLGMFAPAVSGTPSNVLAQVIPTTQRLDQMTYLEPSGDTNNLIWQSPPVSGAAVADIYSDAALMFAQDTPAPTGFTAGLGTQTLSTLTNCGTNPQGIVSQMLYNVLTWNPITASGGAFGYVEMQRMDTSDTTWHTIMSTTSIAVTGYNDYEARIGIQSSYQIRIVNALGFAGPWSATVTDTIIAPGVSGRGVTNSLLAFTTNEKQNGSANLAYITPLDDTVESLTFLEATRTSLQWMYGKNFQTAFQPQERGGEQFSRSLLVQQMAVAGPLLRHGFQSLRDLAWGNYTYVCIRNEIGDRWFMNVQVPGGTFSKNRTIQMVSVTCTETYQSPSAVDPAVS